MLERREANMSGRCGKRIHCQRRQPRLPRAAFEVSRVLENALRTAQRTPVTKYALLGVLLLGCTSAFAQSADKQPKEVAVVELGAAASWNIASGGSSVAPTVAVEVTPIEKWLELEAGITPIFSRHSTEWDVDLLFKKPWDALKESGIHGGRRPGVGPRAAGRRDYEFRRRRGGAGLHVLAFKKKALRLVP